MRPSQSRRVGGLMVVTLLATVAFASILPVAQALEYEDLPVLASRSGTGAHWVVFTVRTDGSVFGWGETVEFVNGPIGFGWMLYEEDGTMAPGWGIVGSVVHAARGGADVRSDLNGLAPGNDAGLHVRLGLDGTTYRSSGGIVLNDEPDEDHVGVFHLLAWSAGGDAYTVDVRGLPGVTVLGIEEGSSAFLWDEGAFDGTLNAQVRTPLAWGGGAHVVVDGHADLNVRRSLVVAAPAYLVLYCNVVNPIELAFCGLTVWMGADGLRVETPDGVEECPCRWGDLAGAEARGPGLYRFLLDRADVSQTTGLGDTEHYITGAVDVRLPQW